MRLTASSAVRSAHRIVGDDGELLRRNRLERARDLADRTGHRVLDDPRLLECRVLGPLQHEVHRDREEHRPRRLEPRLQVAALQRHGEIVGARHLVSVFGGGFRELSVRRAEDGIVDEEAGILLSVDHEQRHAGHERVAHVEHAVGEARISVQADDRRLAGDERIACGDPDRARFVQGQDIGGFRCGHGGEEGRLRRARVAEHERNFVRLEEILNELATRPFHDRAPP